MGLVATWWKDIAFEESKTDSPFPGKKITRLFHAVTSGYEINRCKINILHFKEIVDNEVLFLKRLWVRR
jgi:hypothetical protein